MLSGAGPDYEHTARYAAAVLNAIPRTDPLVVRTALPGEDLYRSDELMAAVVVAPTTAHGIHAAAHRILTWPPGAERPALLLVRDAPLPPPREVVHHSQALDQRVRVSVEIPYLPWLREVIDPADGLNGPGLSRARARRRLDQVRRRLLVAASLVLNTPRATAPAAWLPTP